ncbi:epoxide hydrolase N-terminal domain-containing protein [Streptomyces misionensis]|uniref:epoxide hydrolase N-terminal domain-containing protein n=1 Tax=Streptomyces misionensis TaxID=67331 RepID=UPI0036AD308F
MGVADRIPHSSLKAGTDRAELRRLVTYWASGYDWRTHEAAINALPSHLADIDGTPVHYLRYDGEHPDALPIVLTHGWPSTFLELTALAERLATPHPVRRRGGGRLHRDRPLAARLRLLAPAADAHGKRTDA